MKNLIIVVVVMVALVMMSGCGKPLLDVAAGGIAANTLAGFDTGLDEQIAWENARKASLVEQLKNSNDEAEKELLREQVARKDKRIDELLTAKEVTKVAKEAFGVNWSDPTEVGSIAGLGIMTLLTILQGKKAGVYVKKYAAHKRGTERFMNTHDGKELYKEIGDERARLGVV